MGVSTNLSQSKQERLPSTEWQQSASDGKLRSSRPDSPTPLGVNSLGDLQSPTTAAHIDDNFGMDKERGLYTTFSFQDNEMPISIGGTKTLAKIDTGSDFNVILKTFCDTLPV